MDNPLNPYQIKYLCAHGSHHTKKRTQKAYQLSIKPFNDILKYRIYDKIPNEQLVCPHLSIRKAGLSTHLLALYWFLECLHIGPNRISKLLVIILVRLVHIPLGFFPVPPYMGANPFPKVRISCLFYSPQVMKIQHHVVYLTLISDMM